MNRPFRGAFGFAACVALLAVGCGGRTIGSGASGSSGDGNTGIAGAVAGSAGGAIGAAGGSTAGSVASATGSFSGSTTTASDSSADSSEDAGCPDIEALSYDQSCKSDSDCVTVSVGSACLSCIFSCGGDVGSISAAALTQYIADFAKTPAHDSTCGCPLVRSPRIPACCRGGQCLASSECSSLDGSMVANAGADGDAAGAPSPPSCAPGGPGMTNCGSGGSGTESCCTSLEVTGGKVFLTYTNSGGTITGEAVPAIVEDFRLDKYEVTVGRFRQFVSAWNGGVGWLPPAGSGKHTYLNGRAGLRLAEGGGFEAGWVASDDGNVAPTDTNLDCGGPITTWTSSSVGNENMPITCANWYEAYAFCIWDGGVMPSEAEWEYAAAGGIHENEYPWGSASPGTGNQYAIYADYYGNGNIAPVGTPSLGAATWGQLDLAGNVWEWNLDWYAPYAFECFDCANLTTPEAGSSGSPERVERGGDFHDDASNMLPPARNSYNPTSRVYNIGFRCARTP